MTRRVVFGDKPASNAHLTDLLTELMSAGNKIPGEVAPGYDELFSMIEGYLKDRQPHSLSALIADAPAPADVTPAGQVVHWLFAMGDTLGANTFRALAALSTHLEQQREVRAEMAAADITSAAGIASLNYLAGCLLEAMRLWPTTTLFGRVATRDVPFPRGAVLREGTQVLNTTYSTTATATASRTRIASLPASGPAAMRATTGRTTSSAMVRSVVPPTGCRSFWARQCWLTFWIPDHRQSREQA